MLTGKELKLFNALSPYASENNIEIVTVEVVGSKKAPTIRVFIDCVGGVGFDELSSAQSWINDVMDELDPFPGAYTLEVSSPGIDRPLRSRLSISSVLRVRKYFCSCLRLLTEGLVGRVF